MDIKYVIRNKTKKYCLLLKDRLFLKNTSVRNLGIGNPS